MILSPLAEISAFIIFSFISVAGAVGMTTTMSMYRSGIFLMASFIGVAGLFILLSADLLGFLQIMMYIGGMLVMILYMVLFSHDPGGDMMAKMEMPFIERWFSKGLLPDETKEDDDGMSGMMDMSMFTPLKKYAAPISIILFFLLIILILFSDWNISRGIPDQNSPKMIGELLMGKYMMAFEGAGLMILLGIFGAIYLSRVSKKNHSKVERGTAAAVNETPDSIEDENIVPFYKVNIQELKMKEEDE